MDEPAPTHPPPDAAPPPPPPASAAARPRFTPRRVVVAALFVLIAVGTGAALIALALMRERPRWWTDIDPKSPAVVSAAEAVENGVATALTQVRPATPETPAKPWRVFITNDQANAWLNVRLRGWLQDQVEQGRSSFRWPRELGAVQVRFEAGHIHLGGLVTRGLESGSPKTQALAATLDPAVTSDGALWVTARTISLGRLPVPASWVLPSGASPTAAGKPGGGGGVGDRGGGGDLPVELATLPQTQRVLNALSGQAPLVARPVIKLADGRLVRILDITPETGRLVVTCETVDRSTVQK